MIPHRGRPASSRSAAPDRHETREHQEAGEGVRVSDLAVCVILAVLVVGVLMACFGGANIDEETRPARSHESSAGPTR